MSLSLVDRIVGFILHPAETFRAVRSDSMGDAAVYFALLLLFNAFLSALVAYFGLSNASIMPGFGIAAAGGIGGMTAAFIITVIAGILGFLLSAVLLHLGVIVAGGRGGFGATFRAVVYALTPYYVLGWIPVLGAFAGLWGLIVEIIGVRELHDLTTGRALLAWIISLVIIVIITVILIVLVLIGLFGIIATSIGSV